MVRALLPITSPNADTIADAQRGHFDSLFDGCLQTQRKICMLRKTQFLRMRTRLDTICWYPKLRTKARQKHAQNQCHQECPELGCQKGDLCGFGLPEWSRKLTMGPRFGQLLHAKMVRALLPITSPNADAIADAQRGHSFVDGCLQNQREMCMLRKP